MKRRLIALFAVLLIAITSGCGESQSHFNYRMGRINHIVFAHSLADFQWFSKNNAANGNRQDGYLNWTTDGCSFAAPGGFNFACRRHDFSWRNLKDTERLMGRDVWNIGNKWAADRRFYSDLGTVCSRYAVISKPGCYAAREAAYEIVRRASIPRGVNGLWTGHFRW